MEMDRGSIQVEKAKLERAIADLRRLMADLPPERWEEADGILRRLHDALHLDYAAIRNPAKRRRVKRAADRRPG